MSGVDELRRQLTFKGLMESDFQTSPLKKFSGVMQEYTPSEDAKFTNSDGSAKVRVLFKFDDVEVLECQQGQVYNFPVAEISIPYSNRMSSKWGILAKSLELIVPELDIADMVGKRGTYQLVSHQLYAGKEKGVIPQDCWEIVEIEGQSAGGSTAGTPNLGTDPRKTALSILFGKTKQEFEVAVLKDPVVKKDGSMISEIIGNHFIPACEAEGWTHKDNDGRYQPGPA